MDEKTGRRMCQLVAAIVSADGTIDPSEDEFLSRVLRWFNLFWIKREDLRPLPAAQEAADELQHMPRELQAEAFELLVQAVAADRRYVEAERHYLHSVAAIIGIPAGEVESRVRIALANAEAAGP